MVKIRFRRTGSKKNAAFRIVVAPSRSPRDGRFIEIIGHYDPHQEPPLVEVEEERLFHWLSIGAQLTESVKRLLVSKGVMDRFAEFKTGEPQTEAAEESAAEPAEESAAEPAAETA